MIQATSHKDDNEFFYVETNLDGEVGLLMIEFASLFGDVINEMKNCGTSVEDAKNELLELCAQVYAKECLNESVH